MRVVAATSTPPVDVRADPGGDPAGERASAPTATPAPVLGRRAHRAADGDQAPTPEPTPMPELRSRADRQYQRPGRLGAHTARAAGGSAQARCAKARAVLLTGNDQTVAARPWREIETEDHNLKGWVQGDFLQLQPPTP